MIKHKIKTNFFWFTLVELIVVITVIAILWVISFLSFSTYNGNARDSIRVEDLSKLQKGLETYLWKNWNYPEPNWVLTDVNFSWSVIWTQWTVWDWVVQAIWNLNKKPIDPLNQNEYSYSITKNQFKKSFELSSDIEWGNVIALMTDKSHANSTLNSFVKWNYNHFVVRAFTGWIYYAVTSPTISLADTSVIWWSLDILSFSWKLIYSNKPNTWISFTPQVVWSWSQLSLNNTQKFIDSIQSSFSWLSSELNYNTIINLSWSSELDYWKKIFTNHLWWDINESIFTVPNPIYSWKPAVEITDNCPQHPTSYISSDPSIATVNWKMLSWVLNQSWTVTITPVWWNCWDNTPQTITVLKPIDWICWTSSGQIFLSPPASNLCWVWSSLSWSVIDNWSWATYSWICNGQFYWDPANCSAINNNCQSSISYMWETYSVIKWLDWNCWTSQFMRHWTMIAQTSFPSNNSIIEKWCYNDNSSNCSTNGWFYRWAEAMQLDPSYDNASYIAWSKHQWICPTNWHIPTLSEWNNLFVVWATWWIWNKIWWIVSVLPWARHWWGSYAWIGSFGYLWTSTEVNTTKANMFDFSSISSGWSLNTTYNNKIEWSSVVCVRD
ncbi:MAG: hypothetical protein ACD_4C00465G0003 [uncultured bacterium (gcode 4)]|uniref:Fibrobacter succinogenes major paralogous domain-containing protein n=1 Tax=uncultured bacterium (gcode 4) TaxID=1234023 RepID=K2FT18_9BACT|nr:MAG: hypothetical protein ACD_4C00465G0003 [uncultured bacterium (gcode 4)]